MNVNRYEEQASTLQQPYTLPVPHLFISHDSDAMKYGI